MEKQIRGWRNKSKGEEQDKIGKRMWWKRGERVCGDIVKKYMREGRGNKEEGVHLEMGE